MRWLAFFVVGSLAFGQSFEAASVKPADPKSTQDARGGPGTSDPGELRLTNLPLTSVLIRAFGLASSDQIAGPPSLRTSKYDILAKIPAGTTKDQYGAMLMNLLAERFHMVLHRETRDYPGYELVVAKNGPRMKQSSTADAALAKQNHGPVAVTQSADGQWHMDGPGIAMRPIFGMKVASYHLIARAQTVGEMARFLGGLMQSHLVDKTGLSGRYDFTLDYMLDANVATAPETLDNTPPYILDSVQSQLGLRLLPVKVPLDTVVVDSFDTVPTDN